MSPFSIVFRDMRISQGLRQAELAERLGYEQSYISALEIGIKGPPPQDFVARLINTFNLDGAWQAKLWESLEVSQRKIMLSAEAPENVYRLCNELRQQLDQLHPEQINLMRIALRLPQTMSADIQEPAKRIRRRRAGSKRSEEVEM